MKPWTLLGVLTALLLTLAGCSGGVAEEAAQDAGTVDDADMGVGEEVAEDDAVADTAAAGEAAAADEARAAGEDAEGSGLGGDLGDAVPPVRPVGNGQDSSTPRDPSTGERIIKEGTVTIEVPAGEFDTAFRDVIGAATELGGTMVASTSSTDSGGDGGTSGTVTIRVPVTQFEAFVSAVTDVGEVIQRQIDSQDVTGEYIDLESRLDHLQAQEAFYLGLFDDAQDVEDAIAIQQQLEGIQAQVERVRGRLAFLEDRTSYSTLTVELLEPDTAPAVDSEPGDRPSLARYWETAQDTFVNVIGVMLVTGTFMLPLTVPLLAGFAVYRIARRRETSAVPAD